jgi:RNA polymerase subunit RPABC4/transcription elongation factor Spt4
MMYSASGYCWRCGIVVKDREVFCPKHKHTKPPKERKGHWSGYSKLRAEEGNWQKHTE